VRSVFIYGIPFWSKFYLAHKLMISCDTTVRKLSRLALSSTKISNYSLALIMRVYTRVRHFFSITCFKSTAGSLI